MASLRFHFDDGLASTYYPGQTIYGRLLVAVGGQSPFKCKGNIAKNTHKICFPAIRLRLKGKGRVHWSEQESFYNETTKLNDTRTVQRMHMERYADQTQMVFGDGNSVSVLGIGEHQYPFTLTLPMGIPCSFTHTNASVRYYIKAEVVTPLFSWNVKARQPISVMAVDPLAHYQGQMVRDFCIENVS